jgi:hypothetical protein
MPQSDRARRAAEKLELLKRNLDKDVFIIASGTWLRVKLNAIQVSEDQKTYWYYTSAFNESFRTNNVYLTIQSCNAAIASKWRWIKAGKATHKDLNYVHS